MKAPTEPSTVSGGPTSRIVALFLLMSRRSGDTISCGAPRASGGARMHTRAHIEQRNLCRGGQQSHQTCYQVDILW